MTNTVKHFFTYSTKLLPLLLFSCLAIVPIRAFPQITTEEIKIAESQHKHQPTKLLGVWLDSKKNLLGKKVSLQDSEWFRKLSLSVKNDSKKPLTYLQMRVLVESSSSQQAPFAFPLVRGVDSLVNRDLPSSKDQSRVPKIMLLPGDSIKIDISESNYKGLQKFMSDIRWQGEIASLKVYVSRVIFSDGTIWAKGSEVVVDPTAPNRLLPVTELATRRSTVNESLPYVTSSLLPSSSPANVRVASKPDSPCTRAAEVYLEYCPPNGQYTCSRESYTPYQGGEMVWQWAYVPCIDELGDYCQTYLFVQEITYEFCNF